MERIKNPNIIRQQCYFNGKWLDAKSRQTVNVTNPATNAVIGHVPFCGTEETHAAITAAHNAFPKWSAFTPKQRGDLLWRWADLIRQNKEELAVLMTLEQGKPVTEALTEIEYGVSFVEWFAEEGRRVYGDVIPSNRPDQRLLVIKQPIGVVAAITPWNFPVAMITRKLSPALAAGCTVVLKPALNTPFCALALVDLALEAGFPPGVINVVTGDAEKIGAEMTSNPLVRKVSFTGSTAVGKKLMSQASGTMKKLSLELGGNAPFIVFDDADLDAALKGMMSSKFRNSGQTCVCANRIYVQDTIYDKFSAMVVDAVKNLRVGNGLEQGSQIGPLIDENGLKKVERHVADAVAKGAKVLTGGKASSLGGSFYEPTVLADVTADMLIAKEETFGPVAPLFRFTTEDEVIQLANNTEFGLASYFYSQNIRRIWHVSEGLEYGMVGINEGIISTEVAPFGGVKESGTGREGSKYGIEDYLEIKFLCLGGVQ